LGEEVVVQFTRLNDLVLL